MSKVTNFSPLLPASKLEHLASRGELRDCAGSRPLCPGLRSSAELDRWGGEAPRESGRRALSLPRSSFPTRSGPAAQPPSRCPGPLRVDRPPRPPSLGGTRPRCPPLCPVPSCPHPRPSKTVSAPRLPHGPVTRQVLDPLGGLHCFSPESGRASLKENYGKVSISLAVATAPVSAAVGTHLPARGRRCTCPGARGQGACRAQLAAQAR